MPGSAAGRGSCASGPVHEACGARHAGGLWRTAVSQVSAHPGDGCGECGLVAGQNRPCCVNGGVCRLGASWAAAREVRGQQGVCHSTGHVTLSTESALWLVLLDVLSSGDAGGRWVCPSVLRLRDLPPAISSSS